MAERQRKRNRWLWMLPVLLCAGAMFLPQRYYTAEELGLIRMESAVDADEDGE